MAQWNGNYTQNQQITVSPWTSTFDLMIRVPPHLLSQQMNSTEPCGVHRKNMWKTQSKQHAKKLTANGYPVHLLDRSCARATKRGKEEKKKNVEKEKKKTPALTLNIPFVIDQINHQIERTRAKHDVPAGVLNPRGKTINDLVKRPARNSSGKTWQQQDLRSTKPVPAIEDRLLATCSSCG